MTPQATATIARARDFAAHLAARLAAGDLDCSRTSEAVERDTEPEYDNGPWLANGRAADEAYGRWDA